MANYLKGIGDSATRANEILPSFDARINNFLCGHTAGIIKNEFNEFSASAIDRGVVVKSGMIQAHGFFGASDADMQINFVMPSGTQYVHLYAEIDLSVIPNRFEVKATAMSNNSAWTPRQDNLRSITNGKYQFRLWQVTLTASTIILTDKRVYINKPLNAVNSERLTGSIDSAVTGTTQAQSDNSNKVATTSYVRQAVSDAFNITEADVTTSAGEVIGKVRRQGNFVVCSGNGYGTGYGVTATIPVGFRPKTTVSIGVSGTFIAQSMYPNNQMSGGTAGQVTSTGVLTVQIANVIGQYLAVAYTNAYFYGGWEITP